MGGSKGGRGVGGKVNLPPIRGLITPRRVGESIFYGTLQQPDTTITANTTGSMSLYINILRRKLNYINKFGALGRECAHGAIWGYSEAISNGRLQLIPALNRHFRGLAPDSVLKLHSNFKPTFSRFGSRRPLRLHLRGCGTEL